MPTIDADTTECGMDLDNDVVSSKTLVNTVKYFYDSEGRVETKIITPRGGSARVIYYENNDNGTVVKFTAGNNNVTSHSKTDSFGRKTFDELQLGTGFVSRQFTYHAGDITEEHSENAKLKSTATTQLVSQIVLSDGRTISYEYDAEERITKVTDSIDGTTAYTYDALGQLLTETVNGKLVNSMEYDNYGNIVKKNGVAYTYGDTVWKDKLTKVGTQSITYDKQGNPTSYLGHTLTWEKGRQLKSYDSNTYTYNANGIRTSKTVNGVKHDYILDGTKILSERWNYDDTAKVYRDVLIPLYDNEDSVCGILYNGVPYYFLKNLQGDVIAIVNKDAETVAKYFYDAWGKIVSITDKDGIDLAQSASHIANINPFRYRGYYYDTEIAKYYLQSRYYDANVGRFVNGDDTKAVIAQMAWQDTTVESNLFTYCGNSPQVYNDFSGYSKTLMTVRQTLLFGIVGLVVSVIKYGLNISRIFETSSVATIEKLLISIIFLLPIEVVTELTKYKIKNLASVIITLSRTLVFELAMAGLNIGKFYGIPAVINILCTALLFYFPKLFDAANMIIYGLKNKRYYWDKKWYGIKYYKK